MQPDSSETAPIPFVQFIQNRFTIAPEAVQFLSKLKSPLGIITIVGKYRTGKSLFLNKVLLQNPQSFKVSPTINSCTKGLWISKQVIEGSMVDGQSMEILVIDSEGFGAMEQSQNYNNRILLLALLLSSYFIYNSVGTIDEKSLNSLNIITNLAKELQSKNLGNDRLEEEFPSFLWVVRDFTLKLVSTDGEPIDAKGYLEQALEIQKGLSDAVENKNKIRRMIKHFFKQRDCSTLVTPVQNDADLQRLNTLPDQEFRAQFLEQIANLREKILRKVKPKKLKNKKLTGEMLIQLAKSYTEAINNGSLPNIDSAWKSLNNYEINQTVSKVQNQISKKLEQFLNEPQNNESLDQFHESLIEESLTLMKKSISDEKDCQNNFAAIKKYIQKQMTIAKKKNISKCLTILAHDFEEKCQQIDYQTDIEGVQSKWAKLQKYYQEKYSQNPALNEFLLKQFYPLKFQSLSSLLRNQNSLIKNQEQCSKLAKQNLQKHLQQSQKQCKKLEQNLYERNLSFSRLESKYQQQRKLKNIEFSYIQKELQESRDNQLKLQNKNQRLRKEIQEKNQEISQLKIKVNSIGAEFRQVDDDRGFVKKQVQILRDTIKSKTKENEQLKETNSELRFQIQKLEQKHSYYVSKMNTELQSKAQQLQTLTEKYEKAQKQISSLNEQLSNAQYSLQSEQVKISREQKLYQTMFQTLKSNFETERQHSYELTEANKNMAFALKSLEQRFEQMELTAKKLKEFKRCFKNSSCMQCNNCTKFFVPAIFPQHLNVCIVGAENLKKIQIQRQKTNPSRIQISVKQTLLKDSDSKPYTQYVLQIKKNDKVWTINRKYKQLCDLHSQLKVLLPGVPLSESSFIVNPQQNTKKSLMLQQRRKILERYLNDIALNPYISQQTIWREFIEDTTLEPLNEHQFSTSHNKMPVSSILKSSHIVHEQSKNYDEEIQSPGKENHQVFTKNGHQKTPEQFLKIWNQRNLRAKQVSKAKKNKL